MHQPCTEDHSALAQNNLPRQVDDFVLHDDAGGPRVAHAVSAGHALRDFDCAHVYAVGPRARRATPLPLPQEALMWEEFARRVREPDNARWADAAVMTQEVVSAVHRSLFADCVPVALD